MKRMISKIMLAALVLGSMPMHADFKSGVRTMLQGIGNNSGWTSLAVIVATLYFAAPMVYQKEIQAAQNDLKDAGDNEQCKALAQKRLDASENESKRATLAICYFAGYSALAALGISAVSSWLAKKI
jgi:hypothetical protein